jgi:hypothetical protein
MVGPCFARQCYSAWLASAYSDFLSQAVVNSRAVRWHSRAVQTRRIRIVITTGPRSTFRGFCVRSLIGCPCSCDPAKSRHVCRNAAGNDGAHFKPEEHTMPRLLAAFMAFLFACGVAKVAQASECDEVIGRHMAGQAMLAAQFVASAEKGGMTADQINAVLKNIAGNSAIEEFWITNGSGHAYLTNTGVDFTFSRDPAKQPQASAF